jgi:hypothetical protein
MRNVYNANMLYACKGAHTLFTGQRERERKRDGERESEKDSEKEGERERERERERVFILIEITGALAPFGYLVSNILLVSLKLVHYFSSLACVFEAAIKWH